MTKLKILTATIVLMAATLPANAQKWGSNPEDSVDCLANTSVYTDLYKNKDYAGAYTAWRQVVNKCPSSSKNLYIRGVTILKVKYNAAKTEADKNAIVKELMALYDTRIKYFGEAGDNLGRKALDLEQLKGKKAVAEYYPIYAEAIRQGGEQLDAAFVYKFFDATLTYVQAGQGDASLVIDAYDQVSDLLEKDEINNPDKAQEIDGYMASVEAGFSPYATCEQLVSIYTKKFDANPDDVELMKKITNIMRKKNCTDEPLFFKASEKLHALDPSPNTAFLMAQMCYNKKRFGDAAKYCNEAISGMTDAGDKYRAYILLGMSYDGQNSYSAARNAYRNAADIQPNNGEPYLMIAQLYGSNARSVDDGMGGSSAYWAAVDKCIKAKNVDGSAKTVEAANKLISIYSAHYPKQDKAFMLDLIDGHGFTVPGWIGEGTTVRTRK